MRTRTVTDEVADAQRQLAEAERSIEQARKHLRLLRRDPANPGIAYEARRATQIAKGCLDEAFTHTGEAVHLAELASNAESVAV